LGLETGAFWSAELATAATGAANATAANTTANTQINNFFIGITSFWISAVEQVLLCNQHPTFSL
jgi:hypothetical protein